MKVNCFAQVGTFGRDRSYRLLTGVRKNQTPPPRMKVNGLNPDESQLLCCDRTFGLDTSYRLLTGLRKNRVLGSWNLEEVI